MSANAPAMTDTPVDRRVLSGLENLLVELHKAVRAVNFYPSGHPLLQKIHENTYRHLEKILQFLGPVEFELSRHQILFKGHTLGAENEVIQSFLQQLFKRRMKKLIILPGATFLEFEAFMKAAALDTEEVYMRGGIEGLLLDARVRHIWSNEIDVERLRRMESESEMEEIEPEEILTLDDEPVEDPFLDSFSLDEEGPSAPISKDEEALNKILPILDATQDPEKYYEGVLLLASLAERFVGEREWNLLVRLVEILERHSSDPSRGVELKKYSFRGLRKITTPEVLRALLTELANDKRGDDEIESILGILEILGVPAADALVGRLDYVRTEFGRNLFEQALYRIGPAAAPRIYPLLTAEKPLLVRLALRVLGRYRLPESVDRIAPLASHTDEGVRYERVRALLHIRTAAALDQLYDVLMGREEQLREYIVSAFGNSREVRAVGVLVNLIRSQKEFEISPELRQLIFHALGQIGTPEVAEALLAFATEKKMWRQRFDEESIDEALGALAEAADAATLGKLRATEFKSEVLQRAKQAACARIEQRLAALQMPEGELA